MTSRVIEKVMRGPVLAVLAALALIMTAGVSLAEEPAPQDPAAAEGGSGTAQVNELDEAANSMYGKGMMALQHKHYARAAEFFEKTIALDPSSYNTYLLLGKVYTTLNRPADAEKSFRAAIRVKPTDPRAYDLLVSILIFTSKPEQAVKVGELALNNGIPDKYVLDLGWAYYKAGMYDKAEARYTGELEFRDDLYAPYRNLGILYYAKGDYDKALDNILKAADENDGAGEIPYLLTITYDKLGEADRARAAFSVLKGGDKDYLESIKRYNRNYFPHTENPDIKRYVFDYDPEALGRRHDKADQDDKDEN